MVSSRKLRGTSETYFYFTQSKSGIQVATCNQTAHSQLFKAIYCAGLVTSVDVASDSEL